MTILMVMMLLILNIAMDQLPRDWLKEPFNQKWQKPTIMTILMVMMLLILNIAMDQLPRDWLKLTVTLLPLDLEGMRHHLSRHLAWRDWLKVTVTLLPLDLEGMGHHLPRHLNRSMTKLRGIPSPLSPY